MSEVTSDHRVTWTLYSALRHGPPEGSGVSLVEVMLHHTVLQCVSHDRGCNVTLFHAPLGKVGSQQHAPLTYRKLAPM